MKVPPTQLTVERVIDIEYRPINNVDTISPIIFNFSSPQDEYLKLDEMYLSWKVDVEIVKTVGELAATDFDNIHFVGNAMHSMIKQIEFEINGKHISNLPQNYAYRAFIETLLGHSSDARKTLLETALWNENFKTKIVANTAKLSKPDSIHMMGKIHTDLGFQSRYLVGGTSVNIEITLNPTPFYLLLGENISAKISLSEVTLRIQKAKVSRDIVDAHLKAMEIAPAKYPITRSEVRQVILPTGISDVWIDNFIIGQLPRRMFLFMVDNKSFSGSYTTDPFKFENNNITHICAYIDGTPYPSQPYQPDFGANKYMREYIGLFDALNQNSTDVTCTINKAIYKSDKTIFGFNFSSDLSNGCGLEGHVNLIKKGTLRVQMKFKEALSKPINVLAFCEFDNIIEIHGNGDVTSNINTL